MYYYNPVETARYIQNQNQNYNERLSITDPVWAEYKQTFKEAEYN